MTTTTKTTTEKATTKQINFILKLNPDAKMEEIQVLTKKQASWMIHELLNNQQNNNAQTAPEATKSETISELLKAINWDELKKKYKAFTTYGKQETGGPVVYNDNNGANSNSELLKDMRKFKSYLNKILKEEFHGLLNFKISARTSRHWALSDEVTITIKAPHDIMTKTWAEMERAHEGHDSLHRFWEYQTYTQTHETIDDAKIAAFYKYWASYGQDIKHIMLKNEFRNLYDFLNELLGSFSYDHSDIMSDYFDYGLSYHVYFATEEEADTEARKILEDGADLSAYPISEEEQEEIKTAEAEYWEEWHAKMEEETKKREQERIEAEKREAIDQQKHEEAEQDATLEELPESEKFYCKVSMACKPCNIQEINEWRENERTYYITHLVKFTKQETWDTFKNQLLRDWSFFSGQSLGGCEYIDAKTQEPLTQKEQEKAYQEHCAGVLPDSILCRRLAILAVGTDNDYLFIDPSGSSYCRYAGIYCPSQEQTYNNQRETKALLA